MTYYIRKSETFKAQTLMHTREYKQRAGKDVARDFVQELNRAIAFIANSPMACSVYTEAAYHAALQDYQFRKWSLKRFPHLILFRVEGETIVLQALYAARMDIPRRLPNDAEDTKKR